MAQLICVYAILINPGLWLFHTVSLLAFYRPEDQSRMNAVELIMNLIWALLSLGFMIFVLVGGFKLRSLRRGGIKLIQIGMGTGIGIGVIFFALMIIVLMGLDSGPTRQRDVGDVVDVVLVVASAMALGFEMTSVIWLFKNRRRLPVT